MKMYTVLSIILKFHDLKLQQQAVRARMNEANIVCIQKITNK